MDTGDSLLIWCRYRRYAQLSRDTWLACCTHLLWHAVWELLLDEGCLALGKLLKQLLELLLSGCAHYCRRQVGQRHLLEVSNASHLQCNHLSEARNQCWLCVSCGAYPNKTLASKSSALGRSSCR